MPEELMALSARERRGRDVYQSACNACHGGVTTERIVDRGIHTFLSPALTPEGNVRFSVVEGQPPDLTRLDGGCAFRPRCRFAVEQCARSIPPLSASGEAGHFAACFRSAELGVAAKAAE